MKEILLKNVKLTQINFGNTSLKVKNGISKLILGNGITAETDEQNSQALNLFFSSALQNDTLDNIPARNCVNNSY